MEKHKHPASFLQDVHHLPRFPGGDSGPSQASLMATSSKRLSVVSRQNSAQFCMFSSSIWCTPSMALGSLGNVLSCLRGACGNFVFWGWGWGMF